MQNKTPQETVSSPSFPPTHTTVRNKNPPPKQKGCSPTFSRVKPKAPTQKHQDCNFKHKKNSTRPNHYHNKTLRRITVEREGKEALVLVSNNPIASAQEIAENYKQSWQIELLFKWLKQHLKLKRFLGRSANAVKLQLPCAMMAYLLLKLYQQCTTPNDSLKPLQNPQQQPET